MDCPYCNKEMTLGYLYGEGYSLKWLPEEKKPILGIFVVGGMKLESSPRSSRASVKAHKCGQCDKLIIDIYDTE